MYQPRKQVHQSSANSYRIKGTSCSSPLRRLNRVMTRNIAHKRTPQSDDDLEVLWKYQKVVHTAGKSYDPRSELLAFARNRVGGLFTEFPPADCYVVPKFAKHGDKIELDEAHYLDSVVKATGSVLRGVVCARLIRTANKKYHTLEKLVADLVIMEKGLTAKWSNNASKNSSTGPDSTSKAPKNKRKGEFDTSLSRQVQRKILTNEYFEGLIKKPYECKSGSVYEKRNDIKDIQQLVEATRKPHTTDSRNPAVNHYQHTASSSSSSFASAATSSSSSASVGGSASSLNKNKNKYKQSSSTNSLILQLTKEKRQDLLKAFDNSRPKPKETKMPPVETVPSYPKSAQLDKFLAVQPQTTDEAMVLRN